MKQFLKKLVFGSESTDLYKPKPFYKKQKQNLKDIWSNKYYNDFGIERTFRLFLQLTAFIIPSGLVRQFSGQGHPLLRKLSIEAWGNLKVIYFFLILKFTSANSGCAVVLGIIFSLDTLHFLVCRIYLNDVFRQAISYKRSLMMTFINYVEICLCFALTYAYLDHSAPASRIIFFEDHHHITNMQATYFSFVTSATIGYGDISPKDPFVTKVVVGQIIISLLLVVIIISNITNKLEDGTFYNRKGASEG